MLGLSTFLVVGVILAFESPQTVGLISKPVNLKTSRNVFHKNSEPRFRHRYNSIQLDKDIDDEQPKSGGIPPWVAPFSTAAMGGLLFGSDIGCSSSVVRILGSKAAEFGTLTALELGQVASSSLFGAMISSGLLVYFGDAKIGRKLEFQIASVLFLIGTLIQSLAPTLSLVYLGRVIFGLGIGTAMHVAPLYIAETAPNDLRGKLVSLKEAAIVMGIVLGYGAGALFSDGNWRGVFESALPFEFFMVFSSFFIIPESPRWLALRNRPVDAVAALQQAQGLSLSDAKLQVEEMTRMSLRPTPAATTSVTTSLQNEDTSIVIESEGKNENAEKFGEIFNSKYNRQALIIGVGLVAFQQFSGQPSVLYFANRIFEKAGLGYEAALGVGVFKLVMTIISAGLVENPKFGRRSLLLYGNTGVTVSLGALSLLYSLPLLPPDLNQIAIIISILFFVGSYQIGFGPISWLILSEIFPLRIRSTAVSIGTLVNFGSNLLVATLFELERVSLGEGVLFGQFTIIALFATIFTYKYVFETRGLSLEEIEVKLKDIVDGDQKA